MWLLQPFLCVACVFFNNLFINANDDVWTSFRPGSGYGNRNEFVIEEAVSDEAFTLGKDVYSWKSIKHRKHAYAVGLMPRGLTIIKAGVGENKNRFNVNHTVYDLHEEPMDITLHGCWNKTIRKSELILAVASLNRSYEINWYKIGENLKIEKFWAWSICKKIHQIEFFKQNRLHKMLVITEDDANNTYADTYEFSFLQKEFWLSQRIPLANPTKSSAVSTSGFNYYLSIPQKTLNKVLTFQYSADHFVPFKNISCNNADFVASFKVSFKSYLAVAGDDGGIFEFYKNNLRKIEVEGSTLDGVRFWFPVPVNNFREEVVLLVQRRVETETHYTWHLEAVLHNENRFTLHEEFHCKFHGEEMTGLRCMADEDRENGIIGLTTLSVGQTLGLLIPRAGDAPSGLLMLRTDMKSLSSAINEEIKILDETKAKLEEMLKRHRKSVADSIIVGSSWISSPSAAFQAPAAAFQEVEWVEAPEKGELELKIRELELGVDDLEMEIGEIAREFNDFMETRQVNQFDTVVFNGILKVEDGGSLAEVFVKNINEYDVDKILSNAARPQSHKSLSSKQFEEMKVENLYFENVNGIPSEELVFADETPITLNGDVTFKTPVDVQSKLISTSGKVNEVMFDREVITTEKNSDANLIFETLRLEKSARIDTLNKMPLHSNYLDKIPPVSDLTNLNVLDLDNLYIPVDIEAQNVNTEKSDEFWNSLVMTNEDGKIPGTVVLKGELSVTNSSTINYINGNKFPEGFLSVHSQNHFTNITGNKHFTNILTARDVTSNLVNVIKLDNLVTLSKNQTIPATVKFENIEITERLIVDDDKVIDENLLGVRPTLTLEETNVLHSNLNFQDLHIDGILTVVKDFNGTNFENLLDSVVYKDEPTTKVNSVKEFPRGFSVANNLDIKTNAVNNISLDSFVLKNTDEILHMNNLNGNVTFKNLYLMGLYDGVNVTKLDEDTVKTFGEQYLSSDLLFSDLQITQLFINETLNNVAVDNYLFIDGDRVFEGSVEFDNVVAHNVRALGSFKAPLKNFNIEDFDKRRLSRIREQHIFSNYTISRAHVKRLIAGEINGITFVDLFGKKITARELVELSKKGELKIKDLHVKGSLQFNNINDVPSKLILGNDAWKNKLKRQNVSLILNSNAWFGGVTVKKLNGVDMDNFTREIIFKNESSARFSKNMGFIEGVTVTQKINTKKINGIPLANLFSDRKAPASFNAPGDLHITSDVAIETINDYPLETIGSKLEILDGILKLKGTVTFNELETHHLWFAGIVNGINVTNVLKNVVFVNKHAVIQGRTIFQKSVAVLSNFGVRETVDSVNLLALMKSVVLKTKDGVILSTVVFTKPVVVNDSINITGNLFTEFLNGCDVQTWNDNALFVNKGLLKGKFIFDNVEVNGGLYTKFVNGLDMHYMIPLRSEQQISEPLHFGKVYSDRNISVGNFVNRVKLETEFENTLMNDFNQTIQSGIIFVEEVFAANADASAPINGISLRNIVTTYSDQILSGPYNFSSAVNIAGDLQNNGSINGININEWYNKGLKKQWKKVQKVNGRYNIYGNLTFTEDVDGSGRVNGLDLRTALEDLERKKAAKYAIEKDVMRDYIKACEDVNHILRESKKQIRSFKYFELMQITDFASPVKNIHHFTVDDENYLLVAEENNCLSHLFVWNGHQFKFTKSFETGFVVQAITVEVRSLVFIVTRSVASKITCTVQSANIWLFKNDTLKQIKVLKPSNLLQASRRPGTFYSKEANDVIEYRITDFGYKIRKYRKWSSVSNDAATSVFVPRGLNTGLALISDDELVKLLQEETGEVFKGVLNGTVSRESIPVNAKNEMVVLKVGIPSKTRNLIAFATQEKSSIEKGLDLIKVYEDLLSKRLFQNIPTHKASSLTSIDLENGETLLTFLEDGSTFQVYEYKGIEGFKRRSSAKLKGDKLFVVYIGNGENKRTILGVIDENKMTLLDALMMGNTLDIADLNCEL